MDAYETAPIDADVPVILNDLGLDLVYAKNQANPIADLELVPPRVWLKSF